MKEPTLKQLIRWLKTKPAEETYEFQSNENCLLAQFYKAQGFEVAFMGGFTWTDEGGETRKLPEEFRQVARSASTFGEALKIAESLNE